MEREEAASKTAGASGQTGTSGKQGRWGIAEAKQRFSEVVRAAEEEVQMIYNRERRVAAVVGGPALDAFLDWHRRHRGRTLADAFAELRALAAADGFTFEAPPRRDRPNPFAEGDGGEEEA